MIDTIAHFIYEGRVKVFSINSINRESWLNDSIHPAQRAYRQVQFDKYIAEEVVPFIQHHCRTPGIPIAVTGASFGAFHAGNELFKHPDQFNTLIGISGFYSLDGYLDGYYDENCYFNNPSDYLPRLNDEHYLGRLRHDSRIVLVSGQGAYEAPQHSRRLSDILNQKGIPHILDMWGHDVSHDWYWFRKILEYYVPKLF